MCVFQMVQELVIDVLTLLTRVLMTMLDAMVPCVSVMLALPGMERSAVIEQLHKYITNLNVIKSYNEYNVIQAAAVYMQNLLNCT